ncbi:hypothetical protein Tco_0340013, partial [Tanacetum coccineum]
GYAIQANMDLQDADYFNRCLKRNNAYIISSFRCQETKKWKQTIDNHTTLIFEKYTQFNRIPTTGFTEHYLKFAAYNELGRRAVERLQKLRSCRRDHGGDIVPLHGNRERDCSYVPGSTNVTETNCTRLFDVNVQGEQDLQSALLCRFQNMIL